MFLGPVLCSRSCTNLNKDSGREPLINFTRWPFCTWSHANFNSIIIPQPFLPVSANNGYVSAMALWTTCCSWEMEAYILENYHPLGGQDAFKTNGLLTTLTTGKWYWKSDSSFFLESPHQMMLCLGLKIASTRALWLVICFFTHVSIPLAVLMRT